MENYIDINKALWDVRTEHHINSEFYELDAFLSGKSSLKSIELDILKDITGKSLLHLQCHFGQDTLSLAKLGANAVGVDFSGSAIQRAKELNDKLGLNAEFLESDVYELSNVLDKQFDIVFTTYGVIGWLPDMKKWAEVVAKFLKPGGRLVFVEFHPAVWMFDNDFTYVQYPYFNKETIVENESGTYADRDAPMQLQSVGWNHDLGEVIQSLINAGLTIKFFGEYDYSPFNCLRNMVEIGPDKYVIKGMEGKLPLVYAVEAVK